MISRTYRLACFVLAVALLLAACAPAAATPTVDLTDIADRVYTSVAATVAAGQTSTAAALPPPATETPVPVEAATATPVIPTATPFVVPTSTSYSNTGGGGVTRYKYACDIIHQRPFDNSEFRPGDPFDIKWTIVNTGTATWPAGTDLKYFSGPKMTTAGIQELPEMEPGDQYSVVFDANAPAEKGFHVMTWIVQGVYCYPYVAIIVD